MKNREDIEKYKTLLLKFLDENAARVLKEPVSFIRYPFIDPGSVYHGNVWDWDTYWSVYGLLNYTKYRKDEAFTQKVLEHARGNVLNFFDHQQEDGYIPMMIEVADWPYPYLNMSRDEGYVMNMHKPFLCQQIILISDFQKDYTWVSPFLGQLEKYFSCYDTIHYLEKSGLYAWRNDIMIGVDNDPTCFGRPPFSTANIYLNSFMVMELQAMAKILKTLGKPQEAEAYLQKADRLVAAIQAECWDPRDEFYYSVDVDIKTRHFDWIHQGLGAFWKTLPIRIHVWSGFLPMLAGFASKEQAASLVRYAMDENVFYSPYGVTTLGKDEKMFDLSVSNNPSNWLGPIWLVASYALFKGMMNYGYTEEAKLLCENTMTLLGRDLEETGTLHEYYDPFTGKAIMNGGFINWNILALSMYEESVVNR